jgi:hypothetical protein
VTASRLATDNHGRRIVIDEYGKRYIVLGDQIDAAGTGVSITGERTGRKLNPIEPPKGQEPNLAGSVITETN